MPEPGRVVVYIPVGDPGWELPAAQPIDWGWLGGGRQTMHELAVAIASTGVEVEMRGEVNQRVLADLVDAVGASPDLPAAPRAPGPSDTVIVFEGIEDPLVFARLALSPARVVLLLLAPPGLCGWPFTGPNGWEVPDPLTVDAISVGRAEHFRAAAALGLELWTNADGLERAATAAGVDCRAIGRGRPVLPSPPASKDVDVAALENNRWAPVARRVVDELSGVAVDVVEPLGNAELLGRLGRARTFLHPLRLEANSRLVNEARALGTVPVVLGESPFAVGLDEAHGVVSVPRAEEMAGAVRALLASPDRLARLAAAGISTARAEVAWEPFVERVSAALASPAEDPGRGARAAMGSSLRAADAVGRAEVVADLERHRRWLEATNSSLSWRLTAPLRSAKRLVRRER